LQEGSASTSVSGLAFAAALGLRSTLFSVGMGEASTPPPPPTRTSGLQVPPDLAGAIAAASAPAGSSGPARGVGAAAGPLAGRHTGSSPGDLTLPVSVALAALLLVLTGAAAAGYGRWRPRQR
jgi:hypothetical protein